jgi:hypothetical protein
MVYVYSRSAPIGVPVSDTPEHIEQFDSLTEAWDAILGKWVHYQYHIHSIYDANSNYMFSRSEIDKENAHRRAALG